MGANLSSSKLTQHPEYDDSEDDGSYYDENVSYASMLQPTQVPINQMSKLMFQQIGALISVNQKTKKIKYGTGMLISHNIILTSAHNVFDMKAREDYHQIRFYPGQCGKLRNGYEVDSYYYPRSYRLDPKTENDFAILKIKQKAKQFLESFPLIPNYEAFSNKGAIIISGYPEAKYNRMASLGGCADSVNLYYYAKQQAILQVRKKRGEIVYMCPAMQGQDGTPIVGIDPYERIMIIGIHRGGLMKNGRCVGNHGGLITEELIKKINEEAVKLGAQFSNGKLVPINELIRLKTQEDSMQIKIRQYHAKADILAQNGQLKQALLVQKKAQQIIPNNPEIHFRLAALYYQLENYHEAVKYLRQCEKFMGKDFNTSYMLGIALNYQGKHNEAYMYLQQALKMQSQSINGRGVDVFIALGKVCYGLKRQEEAEKWLIKSIESYPHQLDSYMMLAHIKQSLHKFQEAKTLILEVISKNPQNTQALDIMKDIFKQMKDFGGGLIFFKAHLQKLPLMLQIIKHLEYFFRKKNNPKEGYQFLKNHIERYHIKDPKIDEIINKLLSFAGEMNEVSKNLQGNGKQKDVFLRQGIQFYQQKCYKQASDCFKKVLEIDPKNQTAIERLLAIYFNERNQQDFNKLAQEGLKVYPANTNILLMLAKFQLITGDKQAEASFKKVLQIDPNNIQAIMGLGNFYNKIGQFEKALECYLKGQQKGIKSEDKLTAIGKVYTQLNQLDQAQRYFQRSLMINPKYAETFIGLGIIRMKTRQYVQAQHYFMKAFQIDPNNEEINFNLAVIYSQTQRCQQSVNIFQKLLKNKTFCSLETYIIVHAAYYELGQYQKCREVLEKALQLEPTNQMILFFYGVNHTLTNEKQKGEQILINLHKTGYASQLLMTIIGTLVSDHDRLKAMHYFKQCIELYPQSTQGYFGMGVSYQYAGQIDKAEDYYQIVEELLQASKEQDAYKIGKIRKFKEQYEQIKHKIK